MQLDQLREVVNASGFLTMSDRKKFIELQQQKRNIEYLILDKSRFAGLVSVGDDEINEYYKKNSSRFLTPEKVKLQYLELDRDKLSKSVPVDDAALKDLYEQEKQLFRSPETRKASHILLKLKPEATDEEVAKVEEKAEAIYQELKGGADFSGLAEKYSEDKLSKDNGGDLGLLSRGDMPKAFEDKLFMLEPNTFSKPTRTAQGFEIIKLDAIEVGTQKTFEEVKGQLANDYRSREVENRFSDLTDQLVTLTYENPEALDPAAEELGLKIQETDWVTRNPGKGIAADPKVIKTAFSEDVLEKKQNSELIELDNGKVLVIRVAEYQKAQPRPLAAVRDQIAKLLKNQKLSEKMRKAGEEKLPLLEKGADLATLSSELGGKVMTADVGRNAKDLKPELLHSIFKMAAPEKGKISYSGVPLADGGYALVGLKSVENPKVSEDQLKKNPLLDRLLAEYNERYYDALYQALESRQDIEVFTEQLK
ncbi:MAG TPA: hypothetical protein ENJ35_02840 [Gammaproteobacteria bacterium]|nr:hypothetical protein [Gammaproteobacteria bacterium]